MVTKSDAKIPCKCGGTMRLTMIEPLPNEPTKMQHTFTCECGNFDQYKFLKFTGGTVT